MNSTEARILSGGALQLAGRLYPAGEPVRVHVNGGTIQEVEPIADLKEPSGMERWIIPGLYDLQVNGFAGKNFIDPGVTPQDVRHIAEAVLRTGTTRFLPTVITAGMETLCHQLGVIAASIESDPLVRQMCPGIHVEGPFIHPEDGPRGAHPREHVRPPSIPDFDRLQQAARGHIRLLTLAADQQGSVDLIRHAVAAGVRISIGHHRPNAEQVEAAVAAGASLCTHLGNGSDAMLPRHSNYVWYQLAEDRLRATFIADGQHLPPATLKCMLRAKTPQRSILITDAMGAAGMPPGRYKLGEAEVDLSPEGRVVLPGTPYLAGSAADMPLVVGRAVQDGSVSFQQAIAMAALHPVEFLDPPGSAWTCRKGLPADLAEADWSPKTHRLTPRRSVAAAFACSSDR